MNAGVELTGANRRPWLPPIVAAAVVLLAQLALVAAAGHDIPFMDQWDVEGRWLYPAWREGTLGWMDLLRAHNEHRILWTHLLNLGLFLANGGQWDPLVQLVAGAFLHATVAGVITRLLTRELPQVRAWLMAVAVAIAFLPLAAWHNALWGFQSQVYFSLLFGVPALAWLPRPERRWQGVVAGAAALLAMGAGALASVAAAAMLFLRWIADRRLSPRWKSEAAAVAALCGSALVLRVSVPEHAAMGTQSLGQFLSAWFRLLAWPHAEQPWAALVLNLPLALAIIGWLAGRRNAAAGENAAVALGLWSAAVAAALAWSRGGGDELAAGVPSRYVDFLVLLPLANLWCLLALIGGTKSPRWRGAAIGWGLFVLVGWTGTSAEMLRRIVLPLAQQRDVPVRLARVYQQTRDEGLFAGQPRLFVPHPHLASVRAVLDDPRMAGALPPSLQPERPMGPLSRAARWLLRR